MGTLLYTHLIFNSIRTYNDLTRVTGVYCNTLAVYVHHFFSEQVVQCFCLFLLVSLVNACLEERLHNTHPVFGQRTCHYSSVIQGVENKIFTLLQQVYKD